METFGGTKDLIGRRRRWRAWLVPVAVLVIALATAFVIETLNERVSQLNESRVLLAHLEEDAAEQHLAQETADRQEQLTRGIDQEIARNRRELTEQLGEMSRLGAGEDELARIQEARAAYEGALDKELRAIETGRDEEKAILEEEANSAFDALHEVFEGASTRYAEQARRLENIVDVLTFTTAFLAIAPTAWFVRRDSKERAGQKALVESEERFRSLVQEGADLIWILDADGTIRYVAPSVGRVLGHAVANVVGRDVFEFLIPDEKIKQGIAAILREPGAKITTELRARRTDGTRALFEATFSNMTEHPGIDGIVVNGHDVTERREAEEVLRDSEERYRTLYEDNPSMYFTLDTEGTILSVNRFGARQIGYEPADLVGRSVMSVFCEEDR